MENFFKRLRLWIQAGLRAELWRRAVHFMAGLSARVFPAQVRLKLQALMQWLRSRPLRQKQIGGGVAVILLFLLARLLFSGGAESKVVEHTLVIAPTAFQNTLTTVGVIVPGRSADITVPFGGTVAALHFHFGDQVNAGQLLVSMDPADIEQKVRDAKVAYLKALKAQQKMKNWDKGPEVSKARRTLATAELKYETTKKKTEETKVLYEKGLVARDEVTTLSVQMQSEQQEMITARDELKTQLAEGGPDAQEIADLDLQSALYKLNTLRGQLSGAGVVSPVSGIMVQPQTDKSGGEKNQLHVGQVMDRGALIGSVARTDQRGVEVQLSEADIENVHPGLHVMVSCPGYRGGVLSGTVADIASAASASSAQSDHKVFLVRISLDPLTREQSGHVRLGMSANVTITTYSKAKAIIVPPEAVIGPVANAEVKVRQNRFSAGHLVPVRIGHVGPDGVEILSGLHLGDIVTWHSVKP